MKKIEIIISQAIEEDLLKMLEARNLAGFYTKTGGVTGCGNTSPKMGDPVWPQLNSRFMFVADNDKVESFKKVVSLLRNRYPDDGVFAVVTNADVF